MLLGWPVLGAIEKQKEVTKSTVFSVLINISLIALLIITNNFTLVNIAIVRITADLSLFLFRVYYYRKYK